MSVIDAQRAVVSVCFSGEPPEDELARLGDGRVWLIYREMVRKRLRGELRFAFKRTLREAGDDRIDRIFVRHLAEDPPRTRYFHAVVLAFARTCEAAFREDPSTPAHLADLVAYEAAIWEVSDLPDPREPVGEFDFQKVTVLSPALRLLRLAHAVHDKKGVDGHYRSGDFHLCLHRPPEQRKARTWTLNAVTFDILQRLSEREQSMTEVVQAVATDRQLAVDEAFLDGLTGVLADFIERGVILGSR